MVLCELNGKQFMVTDIVWRNFEQQYPTRAKKIRILQEPYVYFSFDDLVEYTNPPLSEIKRILLEAYINAENKETENLMKYSETDDVVYEKEYEKYYIATEVIQSLSVRLIHRRITEKDIEEYYNMFSLK